MNKTTVYITEQLRSKQCVTKPRLLFCEFDNHLGKTIIHRDSFFVTVTMFIK